MSNAQVPLSSERAHRSASPLYTSLTIAVAIVFAGLIAQVVAAVAYDPIDIFGSSCPDDAWPAAATAIALFSLIPGGLFAAVALTQMPLIWAGGKSEWVGRALTAVVLVSLVFAISTGMILIWLDALADRKSVV